MTVTSINREYIDVGAGQLAGNSSLDVFSARAMVNNLLHFADSQAKPLVAWTIGTGEQFTEPVETPVVATVFKLVELYGPFIPTVDPSGRAYPVRVRVAAHGGNGTSSIVISYSSLASAREFTRMDDALKMTATTTVATVQWLVGDKILITPTTEDTELMYTHVPTLDGLSGNATAVQVPQSYVGVWVTNTGLNATTIDGVYAAEFVGNAS